MRTELYSVRELGQGFAIAGTVNGQAVAVDLPTHYVTRLDREAGRAYMRACLEKVFCAMQGLDYAKSR